MPGSLERSPDRDTWRGKGLLAQSPESALPWNLLDA